MLRCSMKRQRTICQVMDYGGPTAGSFIPALVSLASAVVRNGDRFAVIARTTPHATWPAQLEAAGATVRLRFCRYGSMYLSAKGGLSHNDCPAGRLGGFPPL